MIPVKFIRTVFFTENGENLAQRLFENIKEYRPEYRKKEDSLEKWVGESFEMHLPILFIGATGIAVRQIAPFIQNKLLDSPVVVIDELGRFVIPVLSGHYGGGNQLAAMLSEAIGATAVITTATDLNGAFAVDVFARDNGLWIFNKDRIKSVSSKALKGEMVNYFCDAEGTSFEGNMPQILQQAKDCDFVITDNPVNTEILTLIPKRMILGMGCKKGKSFMELKSFVLGNYDEADLRNQLYAICSIDAKAEEEGLIKLAQYLGCKYITFSAGELESVLGDFDESDFVKKTVGVSNVCERAAICGAGEGSELIRKKTALDGMTLAEARRKKVRIIWQEK